MWCDVRRAVTTNVCDVSDKKALEFVMDHKISVDWCYKSSLLVLLQVFPYITSVIDLSYCVFGWFLNKKLSQRGTYILLEFEICSVSCVFGYSTVCK